MPGPRDSTIEDICSRKFVVAVMGEITRFSQARSPCVLLNVCNFGRKKIYHVMWDQQWRQSASLANYDDPMIVPCVENVIALSTVGV